METSVKKRMPRQPVVTRARPDLSRQLSEQILALVIKSGLQPGDRLPTMKELAETFGVATPTIRESLRRLQATGVIDIRHGSGIYLLRSDQGVMIANPHYGELDGETVLNLLDARLVIEPRLAEMAAKSATEQHIARIEQILDEAERLLSGHDHDLNPVNMHFHTAIARASGNPILAQVLESLVDLYTQEQLAILEIFNARVRDYRDHILIFGAIRDHEPDLAARRMTQHLQTVRGVVQDRITQTGSVRPPVE
jgi:GntR family transcriptional repressor for pyruvate dehydrogenase complex